MVLLSVPSIANLDFCLIARLGVFHLVKLILTSALLEFAFTQGSYGLPTMTCFMPGLPTHSPFNISLHCWRSPEISQFTKNFSTHTDLVKFEARVFVDGRLVAYVL
jgi:hypothetical protein